MTKEITEVNMYGRKSQLRIVNWLFCLLKGEVCITIKVCGKLRR